jgi:hypothetical protein
VLGPAARVPVRSLREMVQELLTFTDAERDEYRAELANAPANDPPHALEKMALEQAEREIADGVTPSAGAAD